MSGLACVPPTAGDKCGRSSLSLPLHERLSPPDDAIVSRINRSYVVQHVEMSGRQLERRPTARERTPVLADGRLLLRNLLLKWR
jgi:hypothetical protein